MQLSEFIREALSEIAFGVHEARVDTQELMAIVPGSLNGEIFNEKNYIEFDIAVTASDSRSAERSRDKGASGGISVLSLKASVSGERQASDAASSKDEVVSRLSFKIPVFFNANFRSDAGAAIEKDYVKKLVSNRRETG